VSSHLRPNCRRAERRYVWTKHITPSITLAVDHSGRMHFKFLRQVALREIVDWTRHCRVKARRSQERGDRGHNDVSVGAKRRHCRGLIEARTPRSDARSTLGSIFRGVTAAASLKPVNDKTHSTVIPSIFRGVTAAASLKHKGQGNDARRWLYNLPRRHCRGLIEAAQAHQRRP
jgi:hypothetical protein